MIISLTNLRIRSYVILGIIFFPMMEMTNWTPPPGGPRYTVCKTKECQRRGTLYYEAMNLKIDPCEDFYQFACGNWPLSHLRPRYTLKWDVDDELNESALKDLKTLLERPVNTRASAMETNARMLYNMCINRVVLQRGDIDFVNEQISKISQRVLIATVLRMHDQYFKLTGESAFFDAVYKLNNDDTIILQLKEIKSPYGSIYHIPKWKLVDEIVYKEFLSEVHKMLKLPGVPTNSTKGQKLLIQEVVHFRHELNNLAKISSQNSAKEMMPITVGRLITWYKTVSYGSENAKINWATVAKVFYPGLTQHDMKWKPIINVRDKEYFIGLANLLSKTSPSVLLKHMQLYFVERHLILNAALRKKLENVFSRTFGTGYIREDRPRWLTCLDEHESEMQLVKLFLKNHIPKTKQEYILNLIRDIQSMAKEDIRNSWLHVDTKKRLMLTNNNMQFAIGLPKWYMRSTDPITTAENAYAKPRAYYNPDENKLYFAVTTSKFPIFELELPTEVGMNIASLGFTIARELYRVHGDCGDNIGNNTISWLKDEQRKCQAKKQCFVGQYDRYARAELKSLINSVAVESTETFPENVADVTGLRTIYNYYQEQLRNAEHACQVLPNFEEYTCDQLFFIAFANSMCENATPEYLAAAYVTADYNPRRFRVNGALRNLESFQKAFVCPSNSPMNPRRKCSFWN